MELKTDPQSRLRDQHLTKVLQLRYRWQEVRERERRAKLHNQKLLQDFQRAQDTLNELVARTEAMNAIRMEYERYLEENFPRWQQKLKEQRITEQRKGMELHLKSRFQKMEEQQRRDNDNNPNFRTFGARQKAQEAHVQMPMNAFSHPHNNQHFRENIHNDFHPDFPFTFVTMPQTPTANQHNNISKETKTFHNIHQAWNSPLLPHCKYAPYTFDQQMADVTEYMKQYPKGQVGECRRRSHSVQQPPAGAPWLDLPWVNPSDWGTNMKGISRLDGDIMKGTEEMKEEKEWSSTQGQKHHAKKQGKKGSSDLDSRSGRVCLLHDCVDDSESSDLSLEVVRRLASAVQKKKKEGRGDQQEYNPKKVKETISQRSSSISDGRSDANENTCSQSSLERKTDLKMCKAKTKSKAKRPREAHSPKHQMEMVVEVGARVQGTPAYLSGTDLKGGAKDKEIEEEEEEEEKDPQEVSTEEEDVSEAEKRLLRADGESKEGDEKDGEEQEEEEEEENEEFQGKEDGKAKGRMEEEDEEEPLRCDTAERDSENESDSLRERQSEDGGEEQGEDEEEGKRGEEAEEMEEYIRETGRSCIEEEEEDEDEDEGSHAGSENIAVSVSGRNICDSLKELYADETENEDLYDQEIEDDTEDEDDDVVFEKANPWSSVPACDHNRYQEDEDENDVEGLLAPQSPQPWREDEPEETLKSQVFHSDSEEGDLHYKMSGLPNANEQMDSDQEFDHFYD